MSGLGFSTEKMRTAAGDNQNDKCILDDHALQSTKVDFKELSIYWSLDDRVICRWNGSVLAYTQLILSDTHTHMHTHTVHTNTQDDREREDPRQRWRP